MCVVILSSLKTTLCSTTLGSQLAGDRAQRITCSFQLITNYNDYRTSEYLTSIVFKLLVYVTGMRCRLISLLLECLSAFISLVLENLMIA